MIFDTFLAQGKTHHICDDYVIVGDTPVPHMIVSDGCSSSKNSDVGARLIALTARSRLHSLQWVKDAKPFAREVVDAALPTVRSFGLQDTALDATLLIAHRQGEAMRITCFGDGVLIFKLRDDSKSFFMHLSYGQNAPFYPTISDRWEQNWREAFPENKLILREHRLSTGVEDIFLLKTDFYETALWIPGVEMFMMASDGICSFCNTFNGTLVPVEEVVKEMLVVKVKGGEFMKRRMKKMLEKFASQGIYPLDDVSVAATIFEEKDHEF